ncbi:MAG TPA: glycoside hydrolase family 38 C-terminal domain-containing protein, partial [Thermoguttaceae bacterium]|nr:glycoside hydrolase family 38 C-terminal domain-containing protein [Thermoguttaceae bacterium]
MDRLVREYIEQGRIGVGAGHSGNHTQEFGTEELCRSAYYSRREARRRWGLDLQAAIFSDINGLSWPVADVYSDAGIRYLGFYPNPWRGSVDLNNETGIPAELFYWEGPSGRSRLLVWASLHYTGGPRFGMSRQATPETLKKPLASALRALEAKWPYDVWLVPWYADNEDPSRQLAELARQWNAQWRWPEIHTIADPAEVFRQVEERFRNQIPVRRGDITPSWAQHPVSTPDYLGRKRAADRLLTTAEKLATVARLAQPNFIYPTLEFRRAWNSLIQSDEHGYGVSQYTGKKVYVTWAHKRHWIDHALRVAQAESERALAALASAIPVDLPPVVIVFNPLLQTRTDVVAVRVPKGLRIGQVMPLGRSEPLPAELDGNLLRFVAPEVPGLGYKVFRLLEGSPPTCQRQETTEPPTIENRFYRLRFSPSGSIASLFDKELQRELVDPEAPYKLNEFVFTWDDHRSFVRPEQASFLIEKSPLCQRIVARTVEPRSKAQVCQTVVLYDHEKRIDLDNRLEHVAGIFEYPRYAAYGYYAFPFAAPGGRFRAQLNGCVVEPGRDQCPIGLRDWLAVQDWVDVANQEFGVTLAQRESHLVEFGQIRTNQNSHDYLPTSSHIYSYLFNNWYQNGWAAWPGPGHVRLRYQYALRSHLADARTGKAAHFGARFAYPLLATVVLRAQTGSLPPEQYSFASLPASNVELLTLKLSETPG